MAVTTYRIENVLKQSGYNNMILLAYLFRINPVGGNFNVISINDIPVNNICALNGGNLEPNGFWTTTMVGSPPLPQIKLNMRRIYDTLNTSCHSNKWVGKIDITDYSTWFYVLYSVNSLTGIPIYQNIKESKPVVKVIVDDNAGSLYEPATLYDSRIFGLSQNAYCDNTVILEKSLVSPIQLTI